MSASRRKAENLSQDLSCLLWSGERALIRVLLDAFQWLGTAEKTHLPSLAKFGILPAAWKITFVLLFWIKHVLFYPLGLRWLLFLFSIPPSYLYFSSSCQGRSVNPFLLVLIATCIFFFFWENWTLLWFLSSRCRLPTRFDVCLFQKAFLTFVLSLGALWLFSHFYFPCVLVIYL